MAQCVLHVSEVETLHRSGAAGAAPPPRALLLTLQSLFAGGYGASELRAQGGNRWALHVPGALGPLARVLESLAVGEGMTLEAMCATVAAAQQAAVRRLAGLLLRRGYLRRAAEE